MVILKRGTNLAARALALCILATALFMSVFSYPAYAGALQTVTIRQAYMYSNAMHAYVDMTDADGAPIAQPETNKVLAYLDDDKLGTSRITTFADSGEAMAYIFLFDISGSLSGSQFEQMKDATIKWAENMGENDRIAIVTFGSEVKTVLDYSGDVEAVRNAVSGLTNNDNYTQLYGGVESALKLASRNDDGLPKRKAVILLSDGLNDYNGGISRDEAMALVNVNVIPFYSLLSGGSLTGAGGEFLTTLSDASRGELYELSGRNIQDIYNSVYEGFRKAFVIDFTYPASKADGNVHNLQISVREGSVEASDSRSFTVSPSPESLSSFPMTNTSAGVEPERENGMSSIVILGLIAAVIILIAIAIIIIAVLNRKKPEPKRIIGQPGYITPEMANIPKPEPPSPVAQPVEKIKKVKSDAGLKVEFTKLGGGRLIRANIDKSLTIGRGSDCGLVLDDSMVSGKHCTLYEESGKVFIEDNGSTNGTIVNGIKIGGRTELQSGDLILLGSDEYRIRFGE